MTPEAKVWLKRTLLWLAVAAVLVLLLPLLGQLMGIGLALVLVIVSLAGYAIFLVGMPLFFWIMGEAGFRIFIQPYYRAWRIQRIRNRRLWDEAAARGQSDHH